MRLADLATSHLTYRPQGLTLQGPMPAGFHHLQLERRLGRGDTVYERAAEAVMTFEAQRGIGLRPQASAPRTAVGVDILSRLLVMPIPCRVVWTVEEPLRTGFGYGTLAGHVETGEEGFLVERRGDDIYAVVRAYSNPAWTIAQAAGPVLWRGQQLAALGYLRALQRAADGHRHGG